MFDILIKNALIVDGTGGSPRTGDLAVKNGRVLDIAPTIDAKSDTTIDATGLVLCPGFIDPHSHWDALHLSGDKVEIKLRQGVCTDLVGNCGESLAPADAGHIEDLKPLFPESGHALKARSFSEYADELNASEPGLSVMSHVGHGTLRISAMGHKAGPPDSHQLRYMESTLRASLERGAAGLTTGLYYTPSGYADDKELTALIRIVGEFGRFHASHIRNEAGGIVDALHEVIRPGLAAGASTHISHLKLAGKNNWPHTERVVNIFEDAWKKGLDLTCDVYPYHHSYTTILSLIPPWAREGGVPGLMKRLSVKEDARRIGHEMMNGMDGWESNIKDTGFDDIVISDVHSGARPDLEGKTLSQAAEEAGLDPVPFVMDLIREISGGASIISASMNEENTAAFMKLPYAMIGSDGVLNKGKPHPRAYGSFPRVFRRYVRELKALTPEEAIHKMTGKTAERLGLTDVGVLEKGKRADMVLFDPETFGDTATFEKPESFATGLHGVFFNGRQVVFADGGVSPAAGGFIPAGK